MQQSDCYYGSDSPRSDDLHCTSGCPREEAWTEVLILDVTRKGVKHPWGVEEGERGEAAVREGVWKLGEKRHTASCIRLSTTTACVHPSLYFWLRETEIAFFL